MASETQVDLFLESIVNAPVKDERALMEFPFFSLQKQPRREPFSYDDGKVKILVKSGPDGMATIWDKDVLIYCASLINDRLERGMEVERKIQFAAYDFLRLTSRGSGKAAYEQFLNALVRLRSTTIITTIEAGGATERRGFGWIDNFRVVERELPSGKKVMRAVEVTLNDWMYRAIVRDRRVLTISRDYFRLTKGIERRLYELARKHCGSQPAWRIRLDRLAEKCGVTTELREFKRNLKEIVERNRLPEYTISLAFDPADREAVQAAKSMGAQPWRWGQNARIIVVFAPRAGAALLA